ncbi:hypothetical protein [uncultured Lamprocystis sp.]|uniref:hypothetical protein n=1 Tax=uncultured Lamprocystis sp. TaxID=543132 RepID=UPI0025FF6BE5|nr:hypothetical protein [uncultured Lamprocystis sp.]
MRLRHFPRQATHVLHDRGALLEPVAGILVDRMAQQSDQDLAAETQLKQRGDSSRVGGEVQAQEIRAIDDAVESEADDGSLQCLEALIYASGGTELTDVIDYRLHTFDSLRRDWQIGGDAAQLSSTNSKVSTARLGSP